MIQKIYLKNLIDFCDEIGNLTKEELNRGFLIFI